MRKINVIIIIIIIIILALKNGYSSGIWVQVCLLFIIFVICVEVHARFVNLFVMIFVWIVTVYLLKLFCSATVPLCDTIVLSRARHIRLTSIDASKWYWDDNSLYRKMTFPKSSAPVCSCIEKSTLMLFLSSFVCTINSGFESFLAEDKRKFSWQSQLTSFELDCCSHPLFLPREDSIPKLTLQTIFDFCIPKKNLRIRMSGQASLPNFYKIFAKQNYNYNATIMLSA